MNNKDDNTLGIVHRSICDTCEYYTCEVTWDNSYFICERDATPELYNTPDYINFERCRLYKRKEDIKINTNATVKHENNISKKISSCDSINITLCFKDDIKTNDMFYISKIENNSNGIKKIELEKIRKYEG